MEYKVLTQKDRWFGGKFEPAKMEQALNAYAQEGWRLAKAVITPEFVRRCPPGIDSTLNRCPHEVALDNHCYHQQSALEGGNR